MKERDDKIAKHIGNFVVSTRVAIERLFFENSATCDNVLNRMIKEKRIVSEAGIPGGLCYYRLSLSEAKSLGIPEHRAKAKKGRALREALQVLWFCCLSGRTRTRLKQKKVKEAFGEGKGSGKPHCAEAGEQSSIIYRIYAPGPNSRDDYLLKELLNHYEAGMASAQTRGWIEDQALGFAVLVETPERRDKLLRLIKKQGPHNIRVLVEVVPGLSKLASAVRKLREENADAA